MARYSRWLALTIALTEAIAVVCQFIQQTDPRFPLVYFTVLSGALAGVVASTEVVAPRQRFVIDAGRVTTAVGVVVSAIVFAALIAPASPTGTWFQPWDDLWVRVATVLFHAVAPVLVITDLLLRPPLSRVKWILAAYSWPLTYLAFVAVAATAFSLHIPYPFLSPGQMGWGIVSLAIGSLTLLVGIVAALLFAATALHRRWK
ncbi:Pr6Pr family membrane protein [Mycobacterium syngnathidarum]